MRSSRLHVQVQQRCAMVRHVLIHSCTNTTKYLANL